MKDTENRPLLTVGILFTAIMAVAFMLADIVVKPPLFWITLMPAYCLAGFTLLHSINFFGVRRAFWFLALGLILPYVAEYLGTNFGAIFGSHWFARLRDFRLQVGIMLPARIPLNTVLTWYTFLYLVFTTAIYLVNAHHRNASTFGTVPMAGALLISLWQLSAGPVAINRGMIGFVTKGFYHGIPLSNFAGWFATTVFVLLFFQTVEPETVDASRFTTSRSATPYLAPAMFGVSLLYSTVLCFRMNLTGAAWLSLGIIILYLLAISIRAKSPTPSYLAPNPAS